MSNLRAYVLCRFAESSGLYSSWSDDAGLPISVIDEFLPDWHLPEDAGILITHMHYRWEELTTLRNVLRQGQVPILILSDGILEYRNTWENPNLAKGSVFQPLFGHKLACIGRCQARIVESWGNAGRCEVVGLPRLDNIDRHTVPPVKRSGPFRLLIATANRPSFNPQQRDTVHQSLLDVKNWIDANRSLHGREIEATWRLTDGLKTELGVDREDSDVGQPDLANAIENADAVITTPSTLALESALRNRPTAILDFHNCPQYVAAAWTISAPCHLDAIMPELVNPPEHKMAFQEFMLQDQLECGTPAKPRMLNLIRQMVEAGCVARAERKPIEVATSILQYPGSQLPPTPLSLAASQLDPFHQHSHDEEVQKLRVELAAAIKRLEQLPFELADKNQAISKLSGSLDRSRNRVEELRNRVKEMRTRFGIEPSETKEDHG